MSGILSLPATSPKLPHPLTKGLRRPLQTMKGTTMKKSAIVALFSLALFAALPALADTTLYDNSGPSTYNLEGWSVNQEITNSFVLSQNSTVTGATVALWLATGDFGTDFPIDLTYEITSVPNPDIVNETVTGLPAGAITTDTLSSAPSTSLFAREYGYVIDNVTFSIPSLALNADTTYWLEIDSVNTFYGIGAFWDQSDGLSTAYAGDIGPMTNISLGGGSETFQILGTEDISDTPEPSSFLLLGSGLAGLAGLIKRKLKA